MRLALVILVAALAWLVAAQQFPAVSVSEVRFIYRVYEDGSIQPFYNASFSIKLAEVVLNGSLLLEGFERYVSGLLVGGYTLSGAFYGNFTPGVYFAFDMSWKNWYRGGLGNFSYLFNVAASNATYRTEVFSLALEGRLNGGVVKFSLSLRAPNTQSGPLVLPTPEAVNNNLTKAGIDYLRITSLRGVEERDVVHIYVEGLVDVAKAAAKARGAGAEDASVKALVELAAGQYTVEGEGAISFTLNSTGTAVVLRGHGSWRSAGDVEKSDVLSAMATPAIATLVQNATLGILSLFMPTPLPALGMPTAAVEAVPLVKRPPSNASLRLVARAESAPGGSTIAVGVVYVGHREAVVNKSGDPARDAEAALSYAAIQFRETANSMASLAMLLPGAHRLVPTQVEIRPASPAVKVQPETARPLDLPRVKVEIATTPTQTATTTPSPTPTQTSATTPAQTTATAPTAQTTTITPTHTVTTATTTSQAQPSIETIAALGAIVAVVGVAVALLARRRKSTKG